MKKLLLLGVFIISSLFAVAQTAQSITFGSIPTKTFNDPDVELLATASSGLPVSYSVGAEGVASIVDGKIHILKAGTTTITASQAGNASFAAAADVAQVLTVNPQTITVTAQAITKYYSDPDPVLTYTYSGRVTSEDFTGMPERAAGDAIGTYAITKGTLALNSNYTLVFSSALFTVAPKPITISATPLTKYYSDADPALTYTLDATPESGALTGALERSAGEIPGTYTISRGTLALNANYSLIFETADFTIGAKPVTVTALPLFKTYGDTDPELTYTTSTPLDAGQITGQLARAGGENVGTYAIGQGTLALSSLYTLNFTGADFTVNTRRITVTPQYPRKNYGDPEPMIEFNWQGVINEGDNFTGELSREPGENAGDYAVTLGTLAINSNYELVIYGGEPFTIFKTILEVQAEYRSKAQGSPNPPLEYHFSSYYGLKNGDTEATAFTTPVTISTTADETSPAGEYPIVVSGGVAPNYILRYWNAGLIVEAPRGGGLLEDIILSEGTLSPKFSDKVDKYQVTVPGSVSSIQVYPKAADPKTKTEVNFLEPGTPIPLNVGLNVVVALAYLPDGSYAKYGLFITREAAANDNLASLAIAPGTLTPTFNKNTTSYNVTVNDAANLVLSAAAEDAAATVSINGGPKQNAQDDYSVPLAIGNNTVTVAVTPTVGPDKVYTLHVNRVVVSHDASLSSLVLSSPAATLVKTGNSPKTYTANVANTTTTIKVLAKTRNAAATIYVNGSPVTSGVASPAIALNVGLNFIEITTTAEDGTTTETATITVTRGLSSDAALSSLALSSPSATLTKTGDAPKTYTATVANSTTSIKVLAKVREANATILVNGNPTASGIASDAIALNTGANVITVTTIAQDGTTSQTATITVTRALSSDASFSSLVLSAPSASLTKISNAPKIYTASVRNAVTSIKVIANTKDANATLTVNGSPAASGVLSDAIPLHVGDNTVTVTITAQDGIATQTATITITRAPSADASFASVIMSSPSAGLIKTSDAPKTYTTSVQNTTTSIKVIAKARSADATIKVNGVTVVSGEASQAIALSVGLNIITVSITAQDGVTVETASIRVTRGLSSDASLSSLVMSAPSAPLTKTSDAPKIYITSVSNTTTSIKVLAKLREANASFTVNGVPAVSGVATAAIPLSVGDNVINLLITAQDGISTSTATITVTRQGAAMRATTFNTNQVALVQKPEEVKNEAVRNDIAVKPALSPNGDGINDRFTIDGISAFPVNTVRVMNRNGEVVYEAKGYDNESTAFDGHGSKGTLQQPGTYFYSVEYKKGSQTLTKTGYLVLKY